MGLGCVFSLSASLFCLGLKALALDDDRMACSTRSLSAGQVLQTASPSHELTLDSAN